MGELKDQADEYIRTSRPQGELRFRAAFPFVTGENPQIYAIGEDGTMWSAAWSFGPSGYRIEGWRPVAMTRYEEEYVDS